MNCCKVQIVFKSQRRLSSQFRFKEPLPYDLMSKVVYKYACGRCNSSYYSETDRHLRVTAGEHIGLSCLTFKKCKPFKGKFSLLPSAILWNWPLLWRILCSSKSFLWIFVRDQGEFRWLKEINVTWMETPPLCNCFYLTVSLKVSFVLFYYI